MRRIILFSLLFVINFLIILTKRQCYNVNSTSSTITPNNTLKLSIKDAIKDFQTGSYVIVNSNIEKPQRYTCFNVTLLYINPKSDYDVIASIQQIQNYDDKTGLDFSLRFTKNGPVIKGIFIISTTSIWTSVNLHYIVSVRDDFRVGTFIPDTSQFISCDSSNLSTSMILNHKLIKPWKSSKKLVFVIPFLSGIKTLDTEINVVFNKTSFDPEQSLMQIPMSTELVKNHIQFLHISYLVVTMDSDFQITNIYDLNYIPNDVHVFVGMTGVRTAPEINKNGMTGVLKEFTTSLLNKNKFYEFFKVKGMVIQSASSLQILFLDGNYSTNNSLQCLSASKCYAYDGYMKYYQNQNDFIFHSECVPCEPYSTYNKITNKCQCRDLYTRVNQSCVRKSDICNGSNQVYNQVTLTCDCQQNYVKKDSQCVLNVVCPNGFFRFKDTCYKINWNGQSNTSSVQSTTAQTINVSNNSQKSATPVFLSAAIITPNITLTSSQVQSSSSCSNKQMKWNSLTKLCECPNNTFQDKLNKKCVTCKQNQIWNKTSNQCACVSGAFRISGVCQFCHQKAYFNGKQCQCQRGYLGDGKQCKIDPNFKMTPLGLIFVPNISQMSQQGNESENSSANIQQNLLTESNSNKLTKQPIILGTIVMN